MTFKLGDRHIRDANKPATYMDANHDKPLWYTYGHNKRYTSGYEMAFGCDCGMPDCTGHMNYEDGRFTCDECGAHRDAVCHSK